MKKNIEHFVRIVYVFISTSVVGANFIISIPDETLSKCVVNITKAENANKFPLDLTLVNLQNDLIIASLHKVGSLKFTSRTFSFDSYRIYNSFYVIESKNHEELSDGLSQIIKHGEWNPKAKYLIILSNENDPDLLQLGNWFFENNIEDVSLITLKSNNYVVHKLYVTTNGDCQRSNKWEFLSTCSQYLTRKSLAVLRKHESIHNCQFKFISHDMWPFVNFDDTGIEGIEQRLLKEFEKYAGVKIKLHAIMKQTNIHGINTPGYIDNMLKKVKDKEFEGSVGGHNTFNQNFEYLSFTYPVMVDHAIFVLAHANNIGPWEFIMNCSHLPIVLLVMFIILCILTSLLNVFPMQERDVTRDILLVLGYILNKTGIRKIHRNLAQRLLFFSLLFLSLWLPYAIHGQLYSSVTKPRRGYEPKEVTELNENRFILFSEFGYKSPLIKKCDSILSCLLEIKNDKTKSLFTITSDAFLLAYRSHIIDDQCNKKVYKMANAFVELRTMLLRRGSRIIGPFNKFILRMGSAGFIMKYYGEIAHLEDLKCQYRQRPIMPLSINTMYFLYIVLIIGYIISFITFIIELILGTKI